MDWRAQPFRLVRLLPLDVGGHALIQDAVIWSDSGINNLDLQLQGGAGIPDTCITCTHQEHQVSLTV